MFNPQPPMPQGDAQQTLDWWEQIANSPMGQQANAAMQQTIAMNVKIANAQLKNAAAQIAIQKGQAAADKWYKEQQIKLAQQAHELAVKTQQQNYELAVGGLTGQFQGNPTMAYQGMQAGYTGLWNGAPTLQAINQQQQFGLQQGQLTGLYEGAPTLAALMNQQNFGLNQAGVTGTYNGAPTLAALNQQGNQTGYYQGQATLSREQAAANAALQAAQIGASLRGPGDWAQYLQAMNAVAGSPASALVASAPGGLGQAAGNGGGPVSLAQVLGQAGVMPGQGGSQPGAYQPPASGGGGGSVAEPNPQPAPGGTPGFNEPPLAGGGQMWAGGSPGWITAPPASQKTGSYSSAPKNHPIGTNPVGPHGSGGNGPRPAGGAAVTDGGAGTVSTQSAPAQQQGWNPYSLTGAIGQVASAPKPTNAQLGLTDEEAEQLQNWFKNPNQAASTWWSSKSPTQKEYLSGLGQFWGHDMDTFKWRERNARPNQGAWNAATA